MRRHTPLAFAPFVLLASPAFAQSTQSSAPQTPRPPDADFVPVDKSASMIPATAFVMPDVPDEWNKKST